jgi:hypothetical protein
MATHINGLSYILPSLLFALSLSIVFRFASQNYEMLFIAAIGFR